MTPTNWSSHAADRGRYAPCSQARRAPSAADDCRGRTRRAALDHRLLLARRWQRALARAFLAGPPQCRVARAPGAAGGAGTRRSPGCRFRRTMAPARSAGVSTICRLAQARADAGELLAAPLASYLALHLGGRARAARPASMPPMPGALQLFDSQQLDWSERTPGPVRNRARLAADCASPHARTGASCAWPGHEVRIARCHRRSVGGAVRHGRA